LSAIIRRSFLATLFLAFAFLASPPAIARLLTEDGAVAKGNFALLVHTVRAISGVAFCWLALHPKGGWRAAHTILAIFLVLLVGIAGWGQRRLNSVQPWSRAGVSMNDRLLSISKDSPRNDRPRLIEMTNTLRMREQRIGLRKAISERANLAQRLLEIGEYERAAEEVETILGRLEDLDQGARYRHETTLRRLLIATYLRWGEVSNCILDHNEDSCLLPIEGGGVHADPAGVRAASELLLEGLEKSPNDLVYRWLLNVANMASGDYPNGVPERFRVAPEVFASEREFPRFFDRAPVLGVGVNGLSGGSVMEDFDGDGDLDLLCSSMGLADPLTYFVSVGDGTFEDGTLKAGLTGELGGLNLSHADYDNDGFADVLVLRGAWMDHHGRYPNSLLHNEGDGTFRNTTEEARMLSFYPTQVGAWADFDVDGHLDLFIGNESRAGQLHPCELYRNIGDGTFEEVIRDSGIAEFSFVKGAAWGDIDNDGDPDLYVSRRHDHSSLYANVDGETRTFLDITEEAGMAGDLQSFPCWFFDYDNDGWQDLFVAGYSTAFLEEGDDRLADIPAARLGLELTTDGYPRLYRNRGDGTFEDVAQELGLKRVVSVMGANFGDIDNDGWLDLYLGTGSPDFLALMANRMFTNDRGKAFLDVTTAGGFGHLQKGHAISFGDIDADGDQDLYAVMGGWYPADNYPNVLFENPGNEHRWVTLRLEGTRSNRSAVGARLRLTVSTPGGRREIHRVCGTGGSFGCSSLQQEIGIGDGLSIDELEIRWPSGEIERFLDVPLEHIVTIREGEGRFAAQKPAGFRLKPGDASASHHHGQG
jgi:hypothetical protein